MTRREILSVAVLAVLSVCACATTTPAASAKQVVWKFDNLNTIGGFKTEVEGAPKIIASPVGKAIQFNGDDQSVFINGRPLVGAGQFTIEVIMRPEGGNFQQRFMHIAETDPVTGLDALPTGTNDPNPRFMYEVRTADGQWYPDAFVNSKQGQKALMFKDKPHPINQWYALAQTFDGKIYRSYINGVLQGETEVAFTPHGAGHVRIGSRMNKVDHFKGSIAQARFTDRALSPEQFWKLPKQ
jgi:hypothetical protein